jgi:hypothetical protein
VERAGLGTNQWNLRGVELIKDSFLKVSLSQFEFKLTREGADFLCKAVIHSCECATSGRPLCKAFILHLLSSDICSEACIKVEHPYRRMHHDSFLHRIHDYSFRSVNAPSWDNFGRTIHVVSEPEDFPCFGNNICPWLFPHFQRLVYSHSAYLGGNGTESRTKTKIWSGPHFHDRSAVGLPISID